MSFPPPWKETSQICNVEDAFCSKVFVFQTERRSKLHQKVLPNEKVFPSQCHLTTNIFITSL